MIPHLLYYQRLVLGLLWLCVMLSLAWPSPTGPQEPRPATPITSRRKRGKEPQPFTGLTHKPSCALCEHETAQPQPRPPVRPAPMPPTTRRPREIDTSMHFCPHCRLSLSRLVGAGQSPCAWSSQGRILAAIPLSRRHRLLSGASWHALARQAGVGRAEGARAGVLG